MKVMVLCVLSVLLAVPAPAQTTGVVQDNVANAEAVYYFHQRNVARATDGTLLVAWVNLPSGVAGGQVQFSTYDEAFQTWSPPAAVSSAGDRARQPALAADDNGNIHATWMQRNAPTEQYQAYYAKYSSGGWSTPIQVSVNDRAEEGTIEVSTDGTLWVVYNNDASGAGPSEYVFAVKSTDGGTFWSATADTLSSGGLLGSSIEVARVALSPGPDGKMIAVWDNNPAATSTSGRETYVNQYDGASWRGEELVSDSAAAVLEGRLGNRYCAGAIDKNSNVYVFYNINRSSSDLLPRELVMHKKTWDGQWSPIPDAIIESHPTVGMRSVSAVVDQNDVIHLAYRRDVEADTIGIDEIAYTFSEDGGATWSPRLVVSRENHDGGYVTVANRAGETYGIDIAWRESVDEFVGDQSTQAVLHANIPYSFVTSVGEPGLPDSYEILANYPNPFNPSTTIGYSVMTRGTVTLEVVDMLGRRVRTLVNELQDPGNYRVRWDGTDRSGRAVMSGVYIARMASASGLRTVKMMLVK